MKCYSDDPLVVPIDGLHIGAKLQIMEEPVEIMDREVKRLKQSRFPIVKVRWNSRRGPEFIWEREDRFQKKYPHLFTNRASSSNATSLSLEDKAHLTGGDYNTPCFRVIDVVNKSAMYLLVLSNGVDTPFGWIAILVRDRKLTKVLTLSEHNNGHTDESDPYGAEGLRESRKLKHGALSLYMGNGMRAEVEAIRSFDLILPTRILNMVPTKKVESTPYEIWHGKAPKLSYLRVWCCYQRKHSQKKSCESHGLLKSNRSDEGLKLIQEEDTQPSENTNKEHNEVAPTEVEPQNVRVPIRRSARIPQAPDRYGFYVDVEEHKLGDLNEPPNYKAALSNPKF
ncbi:hypothetical protein Tco_0410988 [Tanacetum coccineum]